MLRRIIGEDVRARARLRRAGQPRPRRSRPARAGHRQPGRSTRATRCRDGGELVIETGRRRCSDDEICRRHPGGAARAATSVLAVSDTGVGHDRRRVGARLRAVLHDQGRAGTGLGLATVYGVVSQHGGFVSLTSEVGRGTTFEIYLSRPLRTPRARRRPRRSPAAGRRRDDPAGRGRAARARAGRARARPSRLPRAGVRRRRGGARAPPSAPAPIHLLLTDVVMPGMNGRELAERLAATRPETRTLFMSGYTDDVIAAPRPARTGAALPRQALHAAHPRREGARRARRGVGRLARPFGSAHGRPRAASRASSALDTDGSSRLLSSIFWILTSGLSSSKSRLLRMTTCGMTLMRAGGRVPSSEELVERLQRQPALAERPLVDGGGDAPLADARDQRGKQVGRHDADAAGAPACARRPAAPAAS